MSLVPAPAEQPETVCAHCGAALVADQRYCLECGQPCSPVRLAFLDVLSPATARAGAIPQGLAVDDGELAPVSYVPVYSAPGAGGWVRRNAGLLSLLSVLLLCLIAGLLVGHWVTQGRQSSAPQVVKVEGLAGVAAAGSAGAGASTAPSAGSSSAPAASKSTAKQEAEEAKAGAKETKAEKAPPPAPVKASPSKLQKLSTSTGKKHQEEINSLGATPIETG
jgi:hypothetical protein